MSELEVIHAYRHLLRAGLRAVQYAKPARNVIVNQMREAFREPEATYDAEGAKRTRWFLEAAARSRGLEHRILKNLIQVHITRKRGGEARWRPHGNQKVMRGQVPSEAYIHFDMTLAMLNHSMGTLLRV